MIDVNKVDIRNSFEYMQSVFVETSIYGRIFFQILLIKKNSFSKVYARKAFLTFFSTQFPNTNIPFFPSI